MKQILHKTLREMPHIFSSNEFSKQAIKNGLTRREVGNGACASFLHIYAYQCESSRRMWQKSAEIPKLTDSSIPDIQSAISLLKSNGYRIMKEVSDWVEM